MQRVITLSERPWANCKRYYHLLGTYDYDPSTGLFVAQHTPIEHVALITGTFRQLPEPMQELCRKYQITMSTCSGPRTRHGDSSHFTATKCENQIVSPHIEMSASSLQLNLVLPHLAHEIAHLIWHSLTDEARQAYAQLLIQQCRAGSFMEITSYAHQLFHEWRIHFARDCGNDLDGYDAMRAYSVCYELRQWVEESFAETVAAFIKPDYAAGDMNVLRVRHQVICDLVGWSLPKPVCLLAPKALLPPTSGDVFHITKTKSMQ